MLPEPLQQLQRMFEKYPGIGPRQASRFSFFLMRRSEKELQEFIDALNNLKKDVEPCSTCYLPAVAKSSCVVCSNPKRNNNSICVVEKETDAINMEKAGIHQGIYFVLGENISPIGESAEPKERLRSLVKNIKASNNSAEIILALNNTREGNFTSLYIQEFFKKNLEGNETIKITRLGRGLSTGSELEYADEETLRNALEGRK